MTTIDLITGILGAGKTTFIRKYATDLLAQGKKIAILENDFGAVNVDRMMLQDLQSDRCKVEMISGCNDPTCHKRRFKTQLIALGMQQFDRVILEPSGIFDMDEFFDTLYESPLDRWYEIGNVITIVDADLEQTLSESSRYLLASQVAQAGALLYSHVQEVSSEKLISTKNYVDQSFEILHTEKKPTPSVTIEKNWDDLTDADFKAILSSGYHSADYAKLWFDDKKTYDSLYFMNMDFTEEFLKESCTKILNDPVCGKVFRIKGFQKLSDGSWISLNVTHQKTEIQPIPNGQAILIVIGEGLNQAAIERYWGKSNI